MPETRRYIQDFIRLCERKPALLESSTIGCSRFIRTGSIRDRFGVAPTPQRPLAMRHNSLGARNGPYRVRDGRRGTLKPVAPCSKQAEQQDLGDLDRVRADRVKIASRRQC